MSNFKIAVMAIFSICIVGAIIIFAISKSSTSTQSANLVAWGTLPPEAFDAAWKASSLAGSKLIKISYVKKDPDSFDADFTESLAEGTGPDIVVLRDDDIYNHRNKLFTIPYANYTERDFKNNFIEEGELFLSKDGVIALPFTVDPLVMYWNRDISSNNQISEPPKYWDEIYPLISKVTKKDSVGTVLQSAIAMGEFRNITNAKDIIAMLLLQAGTPITVRAGSSVTSVLNSTFNYPIAPSQSAINFYTQFSNPTSANYTWNRSLPSSLNLFLSGSLATYIGFSSEIFSIQQKNSNLNFDVTSVPQIRNAPKKIVFGRMYALALVKQSKQLSGAFSAISALTEASALKAMEMVTNLPPVRRDLLSAKPTDAFRTVFYDSALISHSWIDPDSSGSSNTFRDMIESITSGQARLSEALSRADSELNVMLK